MNFKIICDSSSDLKTNYLEGKNIKFDVIPLIIRVDNYEFIDDDNLNVNTMLEASENSKNVSRSSCPSPNDFLKAIDDECFNFIVTISKKLSGSYNSAVLAKSMSKNNENVFVIDDKGTAGNGILIVDKLVEFIEKNMSFAEICEKIIDFRDSINLLFALNKFDNLVKNGRMSKVTAFIANLASIRPLCYAENGEIKIKEKIRTFNGVLKRLVFNIGKMCSDQSERTCIIAHTLNQNDAIELKKNIEENYNFKEVRIVENTGLCSFYSLKGGIIVSF